MVRGGFGQLRRTVISSRARLWRSKDKAHRGLGASVRFLTVVNSPQPTWLRISGCPVFTLKLSVVGSPMRAIASIICPTKTV